MEDAEARPVIAPRHRRPKLAASLIVTRKRRGGGLDLVLGRRSGGHVFMPKKYVFPGGRVDRSDGYAPLANTPSKDVTDILTRVLSEHRARAAAAAAIRETAEETGLLIAQAGIIPSPKPAWDKFAQAGVQPDAAPLDIVARAITPPGRPRRFDAWFFQVDHSAAFGAAEPHDSDELEDVRWVPLDKAHELDIPIITRFVLSELEARLNGGDQRVRCARVTRAGPRVDEI